MNLLRLAASIFVVSMVACSSGGDDDDTNSAAGSSGTASAGGSTVGGSTGTAGAVTSSGSTSVAGKSAGGGSAGSSSGGSASTGAHCTPGTPHPSAFYIGGIVDQCPSVSGLEGDYNHLIDIELPKPIAPGDEFAFSIDMNAPEGDFEVYGTTRECGDVGEKLSTVHVLGNGIICHAVKPVTGTYTHLIWVWRVAAEMKDLAMCESGTCPAQ